TVELTRPPTSATISVHTALVPTDTSHLEIIQYPLSGLAPFPDRGDHQIRAAHHIATGEHLGVAGLEFVPRLLGGDHPALFIDADFNVGEPGRRAGAEAEGDDHSVGRQDLLGAGNRLGAAATAGVRGAEAGLDDLHAFDLAVTDDGHRLAVEEELDTFVLGVLHFLARAGHVVRFASVCSGNRTVPLADRGEVADTGGVYTRKQHHTT